MTPQDKEELKKSYLKNAEFLNEIGRSDLEVSDKVRQAYSSWVGTVANFSFAVGGAVIPIIVQVTDKDAFNPVMMGIAAGLLIFNGTIIQIVKKHRIDNEALLLASFAMPQKISITKTMSVQAAVLTGNLDAAALDRRRQEQLQEATNIHLSKKAKKGRVNIEMDIYLGTFVAGLYLLGVSILDDRFSPYLYITVGLSLVFLYALYVMCSSFKVLMSIRDKDRLSQELDVARDYADTY